jgi:hypothetical protein
LGGEGPGEIWGGRHPASRATRRVIDLLARPNDDSTNESGQAGIAVLTMWKARAGEVEWLFDEFEPLSLVSVGWVEMGPLHELLSRRLREERGARVLGWYCGRRLRVFAGLPGEQLNVRKVIWCGRVSRDQFSVGAKTPTPERMSFTRSGCFSER